MEKLDDLDLEITKSQIKRITKLVLGWTSELKTLKERLQNEKENLQDLDGQSLYLPDLRLSLVQKISDIKSEIVLRNLNIKIGKEQIAKLSRKIGHFTCTTHGCAA